MLPKIPKSDAATNKLTGAVQQNATTVQAMIQFALPWGSALLCGEPDTSVSWVVTVRAQPPAFPDLYGGELALVSMTVLRSYDGRMSAAEVITQLAGFRVAAIATEEAYLDEDAQATASTLGVVLIALPNDASLTAVERAANTLIVNQGAQLTQRALEVQRQLNRLSAENRDLNSLLNILARATAKPVMIHDDVGVLMAQVYPSVARRTPSSSRALIGSAPYTAFQAWLKARPATLDGSVVPSPLGHSVPLVVEKRVGGTLTLVAPGEALNEFERLVLSQGADVCAIELAKGRAIASAVEQARGDWVQMWLGGTATDDDLLLARAASAGFEQHTVYAVVVFRALTEGGATLPHESMVALVRDDLARRGVGGAVGQYGDVVVALVPLEAAAQIGRLRTPVEDIRVQLAVRAASGRVGAGVSRPAHGLVALREGFREAKDALSIGTLLGHSEQTTFYGDLKLYQLLLALKEGGLAHLRAFYNETLGALEDHDARKQSDLVRTLNGFFEVNGNLARAAKDLDVHRNTLVYRLERIRELTGLDLDDADSRLILHLALKVGRVLAALPPSALSAVERTPGNGKGPGAAPSP